MTNDQCALCFGYDLALWWARVPAPSGWPVKVCITCYAKHCEPSESTVIDEPEKREEEAPDEGSKRTA